MSHPEPIFQGDRTAWDTCVHPWIEGLELVKEAEQVTVFYDPQEKRVHITVQDEGWMSCSTLNMNAYNGMTPMQEIEFVGEKLRFLRALRE